MNCVAQLTERKFGARDRVHYDNRLLGGDGLSSRSIGTSAWAMEASMSSQSGATPTVELRDELTKINAGILEAEEGGDQAYLETLLASDFVIIRAKGNRQDKAAFLAAVPGNAHRGRNASEPELHLSGPCAVYIFRVAITRQPDGTPASGQFWNTRVFVRAAEKWQCVAWQVTEIRDI